MQLFKQLTSSSSSVIFLLSFKFSSSNSIVSLSEGGPGSVTTLGSQWPLPQIGPGLCMK